ncbi:MAG: energy transducer TonB [Candidatus Sulfotelmatobacter sp.]
MKYRRMLLAAAGFLGCLIPIASAGDIRVIANSSVKADTISPAELKKVFLEENITLSDGSHVEPVFQKNGPTHRSFLRVYLGRSDEDLQTYYRSLVFSGKGLMPKQLGSDAEMVAYVARTRGAIGYIAVESTAEGVKTLTIEEFRAGDGERKLLSRVAPEYPQTLKQMNIGGTVRLQLTIAPQGNVEMVTVVGGNPILGEAARIAAKRWTYTPNRSRTMLEVSVPFDPSR